MLQSRKRANLCAHGTFVASSLQCMITWQYSGCKHKLWIISICTLFRLFRFTKPFFADKAALHNSNAYAHHSAMFFTPLSSFSMCIICELVTLNAFQQMKLSPMRLRRLQIAPSVFLQHGPPALLSMSKDQSRLRFNIGN